MILPVERRVYDLRRHKYLGQTDSFATDLQLGRPNFFALTNQSIGAPLIKLGSRKVARGEAATTHVSVTGPQGRPGRAAAG